MDNIERGLALSFIIVFLVFAIVATICWTNAEDELYRVRQANRTLIAERESNLFPLASPISAEAVRAAPRCVKRGEDGKCLKWRARK